MEDIMNPPVVLEWGVPDVVRAYEECKDIKRVAKMYCVSVKEIKDILKEAKIKPDSEAEKQYTKIEQKLHEIGMSEKDFYQEL